MLNFCLDRLSLLVFLNSRWHRLGISIKGNVVTLIKDCEQQVTRPLPRQGLKLSSSGIILIGQQLLDESFYSVLCLIKFELMFN